MELRRLILATIGAMVIMSTVSPFALSHPQDQSYLSVTLMSVGTLEAHASFLVSPPGGNLESSPDSMVISVLDKRGFASGWTVLVDFRTQFILREPSETELGVPMAIGIEVLQGNLELAGQTVQGFRSRSAIDSLSWIAARQFGDGQYDLTLKGETSPGSTAAHTIFVTICGSAP